MCLNLLNHLGVASVRFTEAEASSINVFFPSVKMFDLTSPTCTNTELFDFPSAPVVDIPPATSAPPSPSVSQGQWHSPVEPLPQLPWQQISHWAEYHSLSQRWCNKCYNYVNSIQPKCFCRSNIARWKASGPMLSALKSCSKQSVVQCCFTAWLWSFILYSSFLSFWHEECDGFCQSMI